MNMKPIIKNIIIGAVIVVAIFVVYKFFAGDQEEPLTSTTPQVATAAEGDLLSLLSELRSITLSTDLLNDPTFATLQDFTVNIAPQPVGRRNPFAVIGASEAPTVTDESETDEEPSTEN